MYCKDYIYNQYDFLIIPLFIGLIFSVAIIIRNRNKNILDYNYLIIGLSLKILGVLLFNLAYIYYYGGGDTISYFIGAKALSNLLIYDFNKGFDVLLNIDSLQNNISSFNANTGWPPQYMWIDSNTFSVCRFSSIFCLISFNSFFATSILTSVFSFIGIWKFFRLVNTLYPGNQKQFAYIILFMPSLIFWGSGIMKDSFVLASTCWITYSFYKVFIERKKMTLNILFIFLNSYIILSTKTYVLLSLIPGVLFWLNSAYLSKLKNYLVKLIFFPFILGAIIILGFFIFNNINEFMGVYGGVDSAIKQAQIIQQDLLREDQYGGNNYNIGEFDGSISSLLSVAPIAVFTAIYRPLFWEIGSPTMVFSAIENTVLVFFTITLLLRSSPIQISKTLINESFLLYCFIFIFGIWCYCRNKFWSTCKI